MFETILQAVGGTPLVRLNRMAGPDCARVLVKYEAMNVGGSIKTRTALRMIEAAEAEGKLSADSVVVEATSGNQGVGLALVGAVKGYRTVIVMPDSVSAERRYLVGQYGAEVVLVHDEGNIGKCIEQCRAMAERMAAEDPKVFMPSQFTNMENPYTHFEQTGPEILAQADGPIHGFCAGVGTGGSLSGIGKVLRQANPEICIWAVEPSQAAILTGGPVGSHLQMGIGDGLIPDTLDQSIYDEVCVVSDEEALSAARDLARLEGLLCGISSGSNVVAALRLAKKLGQGKTVVTLLPDTGERYFSTQLFQR